MEEHFVNFIAFILGGLYAAFGGMVHFLYQASRNPGVPFSWLMFFINIVVAFYVGQVLWDFVPSGSEGRGGLIMLAGFLAYPILDFVEKNGVRFIVKRLFNFEDKKP